MHERNVVAVPTLEVARAALVLVSSEEWAHRHLTVLGLEGRDGLPSDDARDHTP